VTVHRADERRSDLAQWVMALPDYSLALRTPDGVIGIDVDHCRGRGSARPAQRY
jgi:hypothetical protein